MNSLPQQVGPRLSGFIPELDGMRAVSIALVLLSHFGFGFVPGILGVTIFFFISGYLITGHILEDIDRRGGFSLPMFYLRRALRLYPALLAMILAGGVLVAAAGGHILVPDALAAVFYMGNVWEIFGGLVSDLGNVPHPYSVLWSLAVEEHYYLVFPVVALLLARRRTTFIVLMAVAILAVIPWRWHMFTTCLQTACTMNRIEHGTDTRIDSILFGAVLASLLASPWCRATLRLFANMPSAIIGMALLLASLLIRDAWYRETLRFTTQGVGLTFLVAAVIHAPGLAMVRAVLGWRPCQWLGRLSYSLYLAHWLVLCAALAVLPAELAQPLVDIRTPPAWWVLDVFVPLLLLSLALAVVSYVCIERPMLKVRRRFGSRAPSEFPQAAPARDEMRPGRSVA